MKFVSFIRADGTHGYGQLNGESIIDISAAAGAPADLKAAIADGSLSSLSSGPTLALEEVNLLPVIPNPEKILCVGLNYESHRIETGRAEAAHPAIFVRFADTLIAHGDPITCPKVSSDLDYEAELAVIISKQGRNISEDDALDYVAGYACFNDVSVRDWQKHNIQFTPGKNFPGTGPFGPYMISPDEAGDLADVHVISRLNGQVMQDQPIREMLFSVPKLIAYISTFTPLNPGDVIATGTPGGVGAKRNPPVWMQPGDVIEIDVGPVGKLVNRIEREG